VVSGLKGLKQNPLAKYFSKNAKAIRPADLSQPAPAPLLPAPDKIEKE
jgi:hypothetical protein